MNHEYGRMFMDMVKRMEASLSQMGRTAKLQAPTQTRSGRIPKEWVKFTGDPATIVKEYQDYERQAYRANFRTWREFFDQFEECIQKDSRFDKVYIPFRSVLYQSFCCCPTCLAPAPTAALASAA